MRVVINLTNLVIGVVEYCLFVDFFGTSIVYDQLVFVIVYWVDLFVIDWIIGVLFDSCSIIVMMLVMVVNCVMIFIEIVIVGYAVGFALIIVIYAV